MNEMSVAERSAAQPPVRPPLTEEAVRLFHGALERQNAGDVEGAIELYGRALRLHPYLIDGYNNVAVLLKQVKRIPAAVACLRRGDFPGMGRLMTESHASLAADYEVVSDELNRMVALARDLPGLYGARMTGGGFGGCTLNLIRAGEAESFAGELARRYERAAGVRPDVYVCRAADGAEEVS